MRVFSIVFAIAYVVAYQSGWSPFAYYPALQRFSTAPLPLATAGPGMLFYGWLACAAAAALVVAVVVPRRVADRIPAGVTWLAPCGAIAAVALHELRWFT